MNICQSCGMPMEKEELYGKNKDGSVNKEYCIYCYPNGEFNKPDETFEEMVETCVPFMMKEGYTEEQAREYLNNNLRNLKRWA
ncbi:zinc ribbon domain-containing protein [Vallitalea okinawensis]|uniref:zinc ribbon domain-containing protein n=1 Tax=Vallitalea okinawensis TaxID=2078660 RepID=UPI000CFD1156|nr:zinc ribbon domain-containing protein [Vallitalea okinawensis]